MFSKYKILTTNEFNKRTYNRLINDFIKLGYEFVNYKNLKKKKNIILRHDVDFSTSYARKIAIWDYKLKIKSHFFFQYDSSFYNILNEENISIIRSIKKMGHTIGFHINASKNMKTIKSEIDHLSKIFFESKCEFDKVFSIHKYGSNKNKFVIKNYKNLYSKFYMKLYYADSGGNFRFGNPLLDEKITIKKNSLQLNLHPIWWVSNLKKDEKIKSAIRLIHNNIDREFKGFKLINI